MAPFPTSPGTEHRASQKMFQGNLDSAHGSRSCVTGYRARPQSLQELCLICCMCKTLQMHTETFSIPSSASSTRRSLIDISVPCSTHDIIPSSVRDPGPRSNRSGAVAFAPRMGWMGGGGTPIAIQSTYLGRPVRRRRPLLRRLLFFIPHLSAVLPCCVAHQTWTWPTL